MKYLLLILVCYAVKCEDVGNNYFVVKMPEDIQQLDVKEFKKPFQVYWNVPTMQCASKRIPFKNLYEKFGIIQNDNDQFIGNRIVVIYNETDFPAIINNKTSGQNVLRNGGVPQEGNLESHLLAFKNNLNYKIPDPYFDGIAVIDFESWRPVFRQNFGSLEPYKALSVQIEKRLHNWWLKMWIEREASLRFETAARKFMQTALSMAKEMRPNALWGYYGFPYCFNLRGKDMAEKCAANIDKENDSIYWLWAESTALFPSLYSSVSLSSSQLSSLIRGRVKEASRVRGEDTPIYPYFWYRYRDAGFITEKDLELALATLYQSKASGFIIWGSSNDVNTVDKCNKLYNYVETVLGPNIAKYTKPIKKIHNKHLENEIYTIETSTVYEGIYYSLSTQSLGTDTFSTETLPDYKEFAKTDEGSQSANYDEKSSTESTITYTEYTNTDESQTLHNFDSSLPLSEFSIIRSQSTQTLNNDETFSTETAIANNKLTSSEENSQLHYNELFSSENNEVYSKYSNTDQSTQTLNNDDISSTNISSYKSNVDESSQTSNIDIFDEQTPNVYIEYSDTEKNVGTLIIADLVSLSESSTKDYKYSGHNTTTLNNDNTSLSEISTIYSSYKESSLALNTNMSSEETTTAYEHEENSEIGNYDDIISALEPSTLYDKNKDYVTTTLKTNEMSLSRDSIGSSHRDKSSQTLNDYMSNEESTIVYNEYSDTDENLQTLNNEEVISSSDSSTIHDETRDYITTILNDEEMSLSRVSIDNNYRVKSLQSSNNHKSYEETTIVYNEYSDTDENVQTSNNNEEISSSDSSTIHDENRDYITTTLNYEEMSLSRALTIGNSYRDKSSQTSNNYKSNDETTIVYNEYLESKENVPTLDNGEVMSSPNTLLTNDKNRDYSTTTLYDDEMFVSKLTTFDNSYREKSLQASINHMPNQETTNDYTKYSETEDNLHSLNNYHVLSSTASSTVYDESSYYVTGFLNNDELSSPDTVIFYNKYINTGQNKNTENLNNSTYIVHKETTPSSGEINFTGKSTDILIDGEILTTKNEFTTTVDDFFINNMLPKSSEDQYDYLIKVDNSTNLETVQESKYQNSTNFEDDYLIIVRNQKNKQSFKENISNRKQETVYFITKSDINHETTKSEDFTETLNDLDLVVTYVDKNIGIKSNEELTTVESFDSFKLSNSNDDDSDRFDYLIIIDNSTNTETYNQLEITNITNAENDYLIIVPDFSNKESEKEILDNKSDFHSTTQTKDDYVTDTKFEDFGVAVEDVDPVVAYINKTIDNLKFPGSISTGDESLNNNTLLSSEEDASDYLIKLVNFTNEETVEQNDFTESTIADNDYIIIIPNVED